MQANLFSRAPGQSKRNSWVLLTHTYCKQGFKDPELKMAGEGEMGVGGSVGEQEAENVSLSQAPLS